MENGENQLAEFKKLLDEFKKFPPKPVYEPTYLELCEYPWTRREEICSRLFAFFFDTRNPHEFGTLFFDTLLEVYQEKYPKDGVSEFLSPKKVIAETEVITENHKRIDILLSTECMKVCIENKIGAPVKNILDDYVKYVNDLSKNCKTLFILFALYENDDYKKGTGDFKLIFYKDFLSRLKQNLGDYLTQCNSKYLSVLTDFILFLDRKGGYMSDFSKEEKEFFLIEKNNIIIDRLIARRDQFRTELRDEKNKHIGIIKDLLAKKDAGFCNFMKEETWGGERYLKGCFEGDNPKYALGIEAGLDKKKFNISFSVWKGNGDRVRKDLYEPLIKEKFDILRTTHELPKCDKWSIVVKSVDENDDEQIVDGLYDVYKKAVEIVNKAKEKNEAKEST